MAKVGSKVHPWYKGTHEWEIKDIARLNQPVKYRDSQQGDVSYDPRIIKLQNATNCQALWFTYWLATDKTKGLLKWGQGSPMLEEFTFLELMKQAIRSGFFSQDFLKSLANELRPGSGTAPK